MIAKDLLTNQPDKARYGKTTCVRCYDWVEYKSQMRASFRVDGPHDYLTLDVCAAHLPWAVKEFAPMGPFVKVTLL